MFDEVYDSCHDLNLLQSREEARRVYNKILELKPKLLMEIGTGEGGSHKLWMDAAPEGAEIILIDLPHQVPIWKFQEWKKWYKKGQKSVLFYDSQSSETLVKVSNYLSGRELDFLFIDGDHKYEAVKHDFESYGKLVRKGGLIVIHDIRYQPFQGTVAQWWKEFSLSHSTEEFVYPNHRLIGTGVYVKE